MSSYFYLVLSGSKAPMVHERVHIKKSAQFLSLLRSKLAINVSGFTGAMIDIKSYDPIIFYENDFKLNALSKIFLNDLTMEGVIDSRFYIVNNLNGLISYLDNKEFLDPYSRITIGQITLGKKFSQEIQQLVQKHNLDAWFNNNLRISLGPHAYTYSYYEDDLSRPEYHKAFKKLFPDVNTSPLDETVTYFGDMSVGIEFGRYLNDDEIESFIKDFEQTRTYFLLKEAISKIFLAEGDNLKISLAKDMASA